ncbi:MAG: iron-containing alcohol dehydrogenase, partial [Rhodobacteraceae bacterium]|nr:iron-containing alcohol dehydrogenase [Paracoccaceae bacterium]
VHGLAGVIGGMTGAAHGAICGALLPHVLRMNARHAASARMALVQHLLSEAFGAPDGTGALESWATDQGLPRLAALGVAITDHPAICAAALAASSMKANPFQPDISQLQTLLETAH